MAIPRQLSYLRALLRSLRYMFAFASFVALAGIILLATLHKRVTTDVLMCMVVCLGLLLTCAFFGWFALWQDPRLRFRYAGGVRVSPYRRTGGIGAARTMPGDIELVPLPPTYPRLSYTIDDFAEAQRAESGFEWMYTMERFNIFMSGASKFYSQCQQAEVTIQQGYSLPVAGVPAWDEKSSAMIV